MARGRAPCWESLLTSTGSTLTQRILWMSEMTPSKTPVLKSLLLQIFRCEFGELFCFILQKSHLYLLFFAISDRNIFFVRYIMINYITIFGMKHVIFEGFHLTIISFRYKQGCIHISIDLAIFIAEQFLISKHSWKVFGNSQQ